MSRFVVDASVAAKWVIEEAFSAESASLLAGDELVAPDHWLAEAANVLWSKVYRGELATMDATERLAVLLRAPVAGVPLAGLAEPAFAIAAAHRVTVYDALYLALAQRQQAPFVTADLKLVKRLARSDLAARMLYVGDLPVA